MPPGSNDIDRHIRRVAAGLLPAVVIAGQPPAPINLAERMRDLRVPGVSIAVIHDGAIQWARGFGSATIGGQPVSPDTLFQAGSISKLVAAMAALALVEAGKLDLDADVNLALKSWKVPANSFTDESKVTLRRLLNHSAGTTVHGFAGYQAGMPVPALVEVLNGAPPANSAPVVVDFRPGTEFRYSGGGYTIMEQVLIDVTGKPFPNLVEEIVLRPLGMRQSSFVQPLPAGELNVATPYRADGTPVPGGPYTYPELAAAGLWTTPTDVARFALALVEAWSGRKTLVLSQPMANEMLTPGLGNYGLGPIVTGAPPHRSFSHDGINDGFVSAMIAFENGDGAVVMTNGAGNWRLAGEILRSIATEYDWPARQPKIRTRTTVSPELLDRLVGRYRFAEDSLIDISREGDRLFAQRPGLERFEVFPETNRIFFYTVVDAVISFDSDGQSDATELILHQGGVDQTAKRIPK